MNLGTKREKIEKFIKGLYHAPLSKKSIDGIDKLCKKIPNNWGSRTLQNYTEYAYNRLARLDRQKRSSVNYFVAILTSDSTFCGYLDFLAAETEKDKTTEESAEESIGYRGRDYYPLTSVDEVEVYYHKKKEDNKYIFIVRDCSKLVNEIMYLKKFNKRYPSRKVKRISMIRLAEKAG